MNSDQLRNMMQGESTIEAPEQYVDDVNQQKEFGKEFFQGTGQFLVGETIKDSIKDATKKTKFLKKFGLDESDLGEANDLIKGGGSTKEVIRSISKAILKKKVKQAGQQADRVVQKGVQRLRGANQGDIQMSDIPEIQQPVRAIEEPTIASEINPFSAPLKSKYSGIKPVQTERGKIKFRSAEDKIEETRLRQNNLASRKSTLKDKFNSLDKESRTKFKQEIKQSKLDADTGSISDKLSRGEAGTTIEEQIMNKYSPIADKSIAQLKPAERLLADISKQKESISRVVGHVDERQKILGQENPGQVKTNAPTNIQQQTQEEANLASNAEKSSTDKPNLGGESEDFADEAATSALKKTGKIATEEVEGGLAESSAETGPIGLALSAAVGIGSLVAGLFTKADKNKFVSPPKIFHNYSVQRGVF